MFGHFTHADFRTDRNHAAGYERVQRTPTYKLVSLLLLLFIAESVASARAADTVISEKQARRAAEIYDS